MVNSGSEPVVPTGITGPSSLAVVVATSPWPRRICWLALALLHTAAIGFFSLFTVVYTQISDGAFGSNTFLYGLILPYRYLPIVGIAYAVLGGLHLLLLLRMLHASAMGRRLCFRVTPSPQLVKSPTITDIPIVASTTRTSSIALAMGQQLTVLRSFATRPVDKLVGLNNIIGVDGQYFDHFFLARELVQVALQTVLLYRNAHFISTPWLLDVGVAIVCANCWSTQVLRAVLACGNPRAAAAATTTTKTKTASRRRQRVYALLVDSLLDMVSAFLVPLVVVVPYALLYNPMLRMFPPNVWANDLWVMQVTSDIQLLFVSGWKDTVTQFSFSLLILISSSAIHDLCHREFDAPTAAGGSHRKVPQASKPKPLSPPSDRPTVIAHPRLIRARRWIHTLLVVWGLGVAGLHAYASARPQVDGCLLPVRPWFTRHTSCAVIDFNCHARGSSGHRDDTYAALEQLSQTAVMYVIFQHCRGLEVPSNLQGFHGLLGLKMYNATIVDWPTEAAVRGDTHPSFRLLTMVRITFPHDGRGLPDGLTHPLFPLTLADANICVSNLQALPSDLHQKWPRGLSLLLEHAQFSEFPDVVTRMDANVVSFNGNRLSSIPMDKLLQPDRRLRVLSLGAGNPIVDIGSNVSHITLPPAFYWLILDSTNLLALPNWMRYDPAVLTRMWTIMTDTPVCDLVKDFFESPPPPASSTEFHWQRFIDCNQYDRGDRTLFRLIAEDRLRSLDPSRIGDPNL